MGTGPPIRRTMPREHPTLPRFSLLRPDHFREGKRSWLRMKFRGWRNDHRGVSRIEMWCGTTYNGQVASMWPSRVGWVWHVGLCELTGRGITDPGTEARRLAEAELLDALHSLVEQGEAIIGWPEDAVAVEDARQLRIGDAPRA